MRVAACLAVSFLLAGCFFFETEFGDTPRLDEIKTVGTVDRNAEWSPRRLDDFPEANLLVHVELCDRDGGEVHQAAMARADAIADPEERQSWLDEYVTAVDVFERQVRYNLISGSISSKANGCRRAEEAYAAWRDTGALPRRLLGG